MRHRLLTGSSAGLLSALLLAVCFGLAPLHSAGGQTCSAGQVIFEGPLGSYTCDPNLFWDNTNKRCGIGTSTPGFALEVADGDLGITQYLATTPDKVSGKINLGTRSFSSVPPAASVNNRLAMTGGVTGSLGSSITNVGKFIDLSLTGDSGYSTLLQLDHTNTGHNGASTAFLVNTSAVQQDTAAGIGVINTGNADSIYVGVQGTSTGMTTPTGIGIDVNRSGVDGENNSTSGAFGVNCVNWSKETAAGCFIGSNHNVANLNPVYSAQTNGYAYQAQAMSGTSTNPAFVVTNTNVPTQFNWVASHSGVVSSYGQPRLIAWNSTNQSVSAGVFTTLTFDTLSSATFADGRPAENIGVTVSSGSFSAPVEGLYLAIGGVAFTYNGTGSRVIQIMKNGSSLVAQQFVAAVDDGSDTTSVTLSAFLYLNASDSILFRVWQTNSSLATLNTFAGRGNTWGSLLKLF
jgi:hypothetical protein